MTKVELRRVALLPLLLLVAASCQQHPQGRLYQAERAIWKARRLELSLRIGPETPPTSKELDRIRDAYERILSRYPAEGRVDGPDSTTARGIARARAQAQMGLVRVHRTREEPTEALRILQEAHEAYPWDTAISLQFYQALVEELQVAGQLEQAARTCQEMASRLPARTRDGHAVGPVQDAPLMAADFLVEVGLKEEAVLELDRAEIYYRSIIDENPRDDAAIMAWVQLGSLESRRGRFDQAEEALKHARSSSTSEDLQAKILFLLGVLQQEGHRDPAAAAGTFAELAVQFPKSEETPEAIVRQAACLSDLGRSDEALELLRSNRERYSRDPGNAARARLLSARILTRLDRWNEALSEYRALQSEYPRSAQAIGSPFEIADYYREGGAEDAFRATLERAVADGDRLRGDHAGTPLARMAEEASVRALVRLERWNEAVERILRFPSSYPQDPRNPISLIEAATILADRVGDRERAATILEDVADRYPESGFAAQARVQAQQLRGR